MSVRTRAALVLIVAALGAACATPPVCKHPDVEPAPTAAGFDEARAAFLSAYRELHVAIAATPAWHEQREARLRVGGLASLAKQRLEALAPWEPHGLVSCGTIDLGLRHIDVLTDPDGENARPRRGAHLGVDTGRQLAATRGEYAYVRVRRRIEAVECYASDAIADEWLEQWVMPNVRADLETVRDLDDDTIALFRKYRNNDRVLEMSARAGEALATLDRNETAAAPAAAAAPAGETEAP